MDDSGVSSDSNEERGRWVGISENVGHNMTFTILSDTTSKLIHQYNVRPTNDTLESNLRIYPLTVPKIVKDKLDIKYDIITDNLVPDTKL